MPGRESVPRIVRSRSFQMPSDVLHIDNGVIDDNANDEGQTKERDRVEFETAERHHNRGSQERGWDGRVKGELQSSSAFVYDCQAEDYTGKLVQRHGTFVLIR